MTHPDITKHTHTLDEAVTEALAAIQCSFDEAVAHIRSLAEANIVPIKQEAGRRTGDTTTAKIAVHAA